MRVIKRYQLWPSSSVFAVHERAVPLHFRVVDEVPSVWFLVDTTMELIQSVSCVLICDGEPIPHKPLDGTTVYVGSDLLFEAIHHLYVVYYPTNKET